MELKHKYSGWLLQYILWNCLSVVKKVSWCQENGKFWIVKTPNIAPSKKGCIAPEAWYNLSFHATTIKTVSYYPWDGLKRHMCQQVLLGHWPSSITQVWNNSMFWFTDVGISVTMIELLSAQSYGQLLFKDDSITFWFLCHWCFTQYGSFSVWRKQFR